MATITMNYAASATIFGSTDLDSLGSSTTFLAGWESAVIDSTSNKYLDAILSGQFKSNNTAPTAGEIRVYVGAMLNDTTYPDVFDGTSSAETVASAEIRDSCLKLAHVITTTTATNLVYPFTGISVAQCFGGTLPPKWFVFITHSMVQTLNATGSAGGQCWYVGVKKDVA